MRIIRIGFLGLGTVGQAVVALAAPFGPFAFECKRALVRDATRPRNVSLALTTHPGDILDDPAIDVIVEVMGGQEPARTWIIQAMANGKKVVTANKEVMAYHGPELLQKSQAYRTYLGYEASVGGGIPILDALRYHLNVAPIEEIYGVVNGTSNYLLNAMEGGQDFDQALRKTQEAGYAEADPRVDVEGHDAVRKLVLLTHLAFGRWYHPHSIPVHGLENWPVSLLKRLQRHGLGIRLNAVARRNPSGAIALGVAPMVMPSGHPLLTLRGAQNGVGLQTKAGSFWMDGPGAGGLATAMSIWADIRRSQIQRESEGFPLINPETRPDPLNLPVVAITRDPDRPLAATEPLFQWEPGLALYPGALASAEGVVQWMFYGNPAH